MQDLHVRDQPGPGRDVLFCADFQAPPTIHFQGGYSHTGTKTPMVPLDGEGIIRIHLLQSFAVEVHQVTNARFAAFVAETSYRTVAERIGNSLVFRYSLNSPDGMPATQGQTPWWVAIDGACWYAPEGPGSSVLQRLDHPVVHIALDDAAAFAKWAGGRLPSEAEWELAARGGLEDPRFPWGDREPDDDEFLPANIWQGSFPERNSVADGYEGTAPVGSFPANGAGLFDMAGNVWEWTADPFRIWSGAHYANLRNATAQRRRQFVMKGGSFLCHVDYCYRYRIAARSAADQDSGAANCGFRVFYDL